MTAVFLLLITSLPHLDAPAPAPQAIAVTHVTVIDGTGRPALPDRTVIVQGGTIRQIGPAQATQVPAGAKIVDATGKYLIPGLWDMHVHVAGADYFPLFLANGVVGVREMHAFFWPQLARWRSDVESGKLLGPHIVAALSLVDGAKPFWPGSLVATNEKEGRAAVQTLKQRGADFVKVYSKLTPEAYRAIADEAKKQGLPFAGHVPESVSAQEASDLGQKSMEHLYGIQRACAKDEESLRREVVAALNEDNAVLMKVMRRTRAKAADQYDPAKARELFARFVRNGTWQCPTLTVLRNLAHLDDPALAADPRLRYMSPFIRGFWDSKAGPRRQLGPADFAEMRKLYERDVQLVGALHREGVRILAGTDTTNPYCFPGFSLHDELALLVGAGLTPMEALQSATRNAAEFLGRLPTQGTIEPGKAADLVLLDANPLDDIHNTRKIAAVLRAGRLLEEKGSGVFLDIFRYTRTMAALIRRARLLD